MNTIPRNHHLEPDPTGWIEELREALCAPELEEFDQAEPPSPEAQEAAYEVAVAVGRCTLFGLQAPEELQGALPEPEAIAAAQVASQRVRQWTEKALQLPERWDQSDPVIGQAMCAELLEARMEVHFVMEAVSQAMEKSWQEGKEANELLQAVDRLAQALEEFDQALQEPEVLALLSTVVELPLLDNWRAMLAEPYKSAPPWWLDGTLEAVSKQIERICLQTLPAGETWRQLTAGVSKQFPPADLPAPIPEEAIEEFQRPEHLVRPAKPLRHVARPLWETMPAYSGAGDTPRPTEISLLSWTSPDGRFRARLSIPSEASEETMLVMEFLTPQEELATELGGQPVWLGSLEAYIEPAGLARFPLRRLREQLAQPEAELILQVGPDRIEWPAMENS